MAKQYDAPPELTIALPARRIGSKIVRLHNAGKRFGKALEEVRILDSLLHRLLQHVDVLDKESSLDPDRRASSLANCGYANPHAQIRALKSAEGHIRTAGRRINEQKNKQGKHSPG